MCTTSRFRISEQISIPGALSLGFMGFDDYKVVLYRNQPEGWVAEIPSIPGCHALMSTREEALAELAEVFRLISQEHQDRNEPLPVDTTEIVHA